jgi:hypothetical protein
MIVYQDDSRGALRNRFSEHLAGMYERRIKNAARDSHIALQPMLGVEHSHMELLDRQVFEARSEDRDDVPRGADRRSFIPILSCYTSSQLQCCMNNDRAGAPDTCVHCELRNRPRGEASQRAMRGRQNILAETERRSSSSAAAQHDGQQFCRRECVGAEIYEPLARPIRSRELSNSKRLCHP